jgi:hypothetical protein
MVSSNAREHLRGKSGIGLLVVYEIDLVEEAPIARRKV